MGLFRRVDEVCPICDAVLAKNDKMGHWSEHVTVIPAGQGAASGQFTWSCSCGPAGLKWANPGNAMAGLAVHMQDRHHISL